MRLLKDKMFLLISCLSVLFFVLGVQCAFYISAVNSLSGNTFVDILFPIVAFVGMIIAPFVGSVASIVSLVIERKMIIHFLLFVTLPLNFFLSGTLLVPWLLSCLR